MIGIRQIRDGRQRGIFDPLRGISGVVGADSASGGWSDDGLRDGDGGGGGSGNVDGMNNLGAGGSGFEHGKRRRFR